MVFFFVEPAGEGGAFLSCFFPWSVSLSLDHSTRRFNASVLAGERRFPAKLQTMCHCLDQGGFSLLLLPLVCLSVPRPLHLRFNASVLAGERRFPAKLQTMCHCLDQVVSERFPGDSITATGTVIFLRFYNPALGNLPLPLTLHPAQLTYLPWPLYLSPSCQPANR